MAGASSFVAVGAGLLVVASTVAARADEAALRLAGAPDGALVVSKCSICHSIDYIPMNAPFLARAGWEAEVRKMIKVMGAPIDESESARIVDYLTQYYGSDAH